MSPTKQLSTTSPRAQHGGASKVANFLLGLFCIIFTVLPIANIAFVLASTGADNLSNDYLQYVGLVDKILNGGYNWLNYIPDTFYRTHSVALPVLIHIADAHFFSWNIYIELTAGIAFALLRFALLFSALSADLSTRQKLLLCPAMSLILFSNSQMSVFCYGDGALTIEMSLFGFALGLWGLTRKNQPRLAICCMLLGGLISSYSWGNGLVTWLVFLIGLLALNYRQPIAFIAWGVGLSLCLIPYVQALVVAPLFHAVPARAGTTIVSLFNWRFLINMIGWPFANDIAGHAQGLAAARAVGWLGLTFAAVGVLLLSMSKRVDLWRKSAPSLLLVAHGLISIWQIGVFRSLLAAWYTAVSVTFWLGLIGLACHLYRWVAHRSSAEVPAGGLKVAVRIWCLALPVVLIALYTTTNLTYDDKTDMLYSRSPASASALRHYRTGPTYGESLIFQWGAGNPGLVELLAEPLERHQLSVFAPKQTWSLQGDFGLDSVRLSGPYIPAATAQSDKAPNSPPNSSNKAPQAIWTTGVSSKESLPWYHYRRLNLLMPCGDSISWTVAIPAGVKRAELRTSATFDGTESKVQNSANNERRTPVTFTVSVKTPAEAEHMLYSYTTSQNKHSWHDFSVPLTSYAGQRITIRLSSKARAGSTLAAAVFQHPVIEIEKESKTAEPPAVITTPSNCDLSPDFVATTDSDFLLDDNSVKLRALGNGRLESSRLETPEHLTDFSHFVIEASADSIVVPRVVTVVISTEGHERALNFQIPLVADGKRHFYSYDLKLLPPSDGIKPSGLILSATVGPKSAGLLKVHSARFVRRAAVK